MGLHYDISLRTRTGCLVAGLNDLAATGDWHGRVCCAANSLTVEMSRGGAGGVHVLAFCLANIFLPFQENNDRPRMQSIFCSGRRLFSSRLFLIAVVVFNAWLLFPELLAEMLCVGVLNHVPPQLDSDRHLLINLWDSYQAVYRSDVRQILEWSINK